MNTYLHDGACSKSLDIARREGLRWLHGVTATLSRAVVWLAVSLLKLYRLTLSPYLGQRCRFHPSCSRYAELSFRRFGVWRGSYLALRRILRCGPWHPGGVDDVPPLADDPTHSHAHPHHCRTDA